MCPTTDRPRPGFRPLRHLRQNALSSEFTPSVGSSYSPLSLITVDGVQLLLIIGAGIAISAVAKKRPRTRADHRDPGRGGLVHPRGAAEGTTIRWVTRRLKFDLSAERAEEERLRKAGRQIVADAAADLDASF